MWRSAEHRDSIQRTKRGGLIVRNLIAIYGFTLLGAERKYTRDKIWWKANDIHRSIRNSIVESLIGLIEHGYNYGHII